MPEYTPSSAEGSQYSTWGGGGTTSRQEVSNPQAGAEAAINSFLFVMDIQVNGAQYLPQVSHGIDEVKQAADAAAPSIDKASLQTEKFDRNSHEVTVTTGSLTRSMFQLNMSILGMNMSLLGMMYNLKQSGLVSKGTSDAIMKVVAPIQMVASVMGFAMSATQAYTIVSDFATEKHRINATKMEITNAKLANSNYRLFISATAALSAFGGLAALFLAFQTKSAPVRAALLGLSTALLVYATASWAAAAGNYALLSSLGPPGWIAMAVGAGLVVGIISFLLSEMHMMPGLWKGGITRGRTTATIGELGPEAVIPLSSPSARNMMNSLGGGSGTTIINNYISADRPATLYRKTNQAVRRNKFLSGD
jgi:hypothetical protein